MSDHVASKPVMLQLQPAPELQLQPAPEVRLQPGSELDGLVVYPPIPPADMRELQVKLAQMPAATAALVAAGLPHEPRFLDPTTYAAAAAAAAASASEPVPSTAANAESDLPAEPPAKKKAKAPVALGPIPTVDLFSNNKTRLGRVELSDSYYCQVAAVVWDSGNGFRNYNQFSIGRVGTDGNKDYTMSLPVSLLPRLAKAAEYFSTS